MHNIISNKKNSDSTLYSLPEKVRRMLCIWLGIVLLFIFATVIIGGITRLTDSGLSMVDWKPLIGVIPPISESEWQNKFVQYQQFPEYQQLNRGMSLQEFKWIFFWEYLHRMLARAIGVVFFIPFAFFLIRYKFPKPISRRLWLLFVLGGCQGLLGWFMVKSGLVDVPYVSHLRLTSHLCLALGIYGYMLWTLLNIYKGFPITKSRGKEYQHSTATQHPAFPNYVYYSFLILIFVQIAYGGFTAGLKAGFIYNSFPLMGGGFTPPDFWTLTPSWLNFFNHPPVVQWTHRTLGWFLFITVHVLWYFRTNSNARVLNRLLLVTWMQFGLGITTILTHVSVPIASLHQAGAVLLWSLGILYVHNALKPSSITLSK